MVGCRHYSAASHANSGSSVSSKVLARWKFDVDSRVGGVALGRDASRLQNQRLEFLRAGVLTCRGSGFARDIFFHQGAAVVVGAGVQAELRQARFSLTQET